VPLRVCEHMYEHVYEHVYDHVHVYMSMCECGVVWCVTLRCHGKTRHGMSAYLNSHDSSLIIFPSFLYSLCFSVQVASGPAARARSPPRKSVSPGDCSTLALELLVWRGAGARSYEMSPSG
jgi:hypothetical protein